MGETVPAVEGHTSFASMASLRAALPAPSPRPDELRRATSASSEAVEPGIRGAKRSRDDEEGDILGAERTVEMRALATNAAQAIDGAVQPQPQPTTSVAASAASSEPPTVKRSNYLSWEDYFMAVAFLSAQRSKVRCFDELPPKRWRVSDMARARRIRRHK